MYSELTKLTGLLKANVFIDVYNRFLGLFPDSFHWFVSLLILIFIVFTLFRLIKRNFLFILLAILLFPVVYPVLRDFVFEISSFVVYLWNIVKMGK
jgi:hypothetical protein